MAIKDYAQDGASSFSYTGYPPTHDGLLSYINDGDDNSSYITFGWTDSSFSQGTYQYDVSISSRFIKEIKYITQFRGAHGSSGAVFGQGFKLQYYNSSGWHTLYTQGMVTSFTEDKTTRSYTNGGAGFENVSKIRLWVEWWAEYFGGTHAYAKSFCFSLILLSTYYPASGFRVKTNDGYIGIGKDTAVGTHKLRFYDGAAVQGLPLLATSSRYATNIRVYDGAATKALAAIVD